MATDPWHHGVQLWQIRADMVPKRQVYVRCCASRHGRRLGMRMFPPQRSQQDILWHAERSGRTLVLLVVVGLILALQASLHAADQPSKGGTIVWAVHEGMPDFDIHYQNTYIAAQPIGRLYNGLLTFDVYDNEKIVGDLAEHWNVAPDGKQITFALRKGVKFHDGSDFTCADAKYSLEKLADPKRASPLYVTIMETVYAGASCTDDFTLVLS